MFANAHTAHERDPRTAVCFTCYSGCDAAHISISSSRLGSFPSDGDQARPDDRRTTMTKFLTTLMIGASLLGAAPAFAGNSADVIQQGGGLNTIEAEQRG